MRLPHIHDHLRQRHGTSMPIIQVRPAPPPPDHFMAAKRASLRKRPKRSRDIPFITGVEPKGRIAEDLRHRPAPRADHRYAQPHRLKRWNAEALVQSRKDKCRCSFIEPAQIAVRHPADGDNPDSRCR
jgi:hypothetical protein